MKNLLNNANKRGKRILTAIILAFLAFSCVGVLFAAGATIFARANINAGTITMTATTSFTYGTNEQEITFTKPGEQKAITIATKNETASVLQMSYSLKATDGNGKSISESTVEGVKNLPSAILVYLKKNVTIDESTGKIKSCKSAEYLGTLTELTSDKNKSLLGSYIQAGSADDATSMKDAIVLELHIAASDSVYQGNSLTLSTTATTSNADYEENIFVTSAAEFTAAINDVNSGLLTTAPKIVLLGDVTVDKELTLTASTPLTIDLNGYTLSGSSLKISNEKTYIWFEGEGENSANITLSAYDSATVLKKLQVCAAEALKDGVESGKTCDIFGANKFYAPTVDTTASSKLSDDTTPTYTYADGVVKAATITRSSVESITIGEGDDATIEFQVLDSDHYLEDKYLSHVPNTTITKGDAGDKTKTVPTVTGNLFLPTSIREEGATIEWTSSNEGVMSSSGVITAIKADKAPLTLYAAITVNGVTYTREFSFNVSVHTNEVNFYKMVAQMSPIIIYETGSTTSGMGLYELPVASDDNDSTKWDPYDYRNNYQTPSASSFWTTNKPPENETRLYDHKEYQNIYLTKLSYSEIYESDGKTKTYSYISLNEDDDGGYQVYLPQSTMETYGELTITGEFSTGDVYEGKVLVIIATGSDTTIYDAAFKSAKETLEQANVLKNILASRVANGMGEEEAYIYMPATLTTASGEAVTMTYDTSTADEEGVVTEVSTEKESVDIDGDGEKEDCYKITLDPTKFSDVETTVPITVYAEWNGMTRNNTLSFTVPAAVHTADLGDDASLFNSIKYQIYQQLPSAEQTGESGFTVKGTAITNSTPDYILLRDIWGDEKYNAKYEWYTEQNNHYEYEGYGTTKYAGCEELWFYTTENNTSYTDSTARDFAALINWATGKSTCTAQSVVKNTGNLDGLGSTKANGKEYLDDNEVAVLKAYYKAATGASEDDWETLWNEVAEKAPGYLITDGAAIETKAGELSGGDATMYYKYSEVIQWATDFRDNTYNLPNTGYATGVSYATDKITNELIFSTKDYGSKITVSFTRNTISGSGDTTITDREYSYIGTINGLYWYYKGGFSDIKYTKYNAYTVKIDSAKDANSNKIDETTLETLDGTTITNYLDDDTEYISPGETEVIFAFWYSQKGADGFKKYAEAFYNSTVIPTYFTDEGVQKIMQAFYKSAAKDSENKATALTGSDGFTTAAITVGTEAKKDSLKTTSYGVEVAPAIVNLDSLSQGLSYFTQLKALYVYGSGAGEDDATLPAFLSDYTLSAAISRLRVSTTDSTTNKSSIETLVLQHVADNYLSFSLSNIKFFDNLTQIDVSDNSGITNVNPLVNYNSDSYTYVDFSKVSVDSEFYQYALNNLGHGEKTDDSGNTTTAATDIYYGLARSHESGNNAGVISDLSEIESLIAENMYLATKVYADDTNNPDTVYWRIEKGNKMTVVYSAKYESTQSAKGHWSEGEMQSLISPYYYCSSDTTDSQGNALTAGNLYQLNFNSDGTYTIKNAVLENVSADVNSVTAPDTSEIATLWPNEVGTQLPDTATSYSYTVADGATLKNGDTELTATTFGVTISTDTTTWTKTWENKYSNTVSYYWDSSSSSIKKRTYYVGKKSKSEGHETTTYSFSVWYGETSTTIADGSTLTDGTTTITLSSDGTTITITNSTDDTTTTITLGGYKSSNYESITIDGTKYSYTKYNYDTSSNTTWKTSDSTYYSYVRDISTVSTQTANINTLHYDTNGNTTTYYVGGNGIASTRYSPYENYKMEVSNGSLVWVAQNTSSEVMQCMDGILTTANSHFTDLHYGEYYGMYYAYNGVTTENYANGTIYRIMPNAANSAFVYITANPKGTSSATTGYYYCGETFTDSNGNSFEQDKIYYITFDDDGNVTKVNPVENFEATNEEPAAENNGEWDSTTTAETRSDSESDSYTVTAGNVTFNCVKIASIEYDKLLTVSEAMLSLDDNGSSWSILTQKDYEKLMSGKAEGQTLGISGTSDTNFKPIKIIDDGTNVSINDSTTEATGDYVSYYLYSPSLKVFAGFNVTKTDGWGSVNVVSLADSAANPDYDPNYKENATVVNAEYRVRYYIADVSVTVGEKISTGYTFMAAYQGKVEQIDYSSISEWSNKLHNDSSFYKELSYNWNWERTDHFMLAAYGGNNWANVYGRGLYLFADDGATLNSKFETGTLFNITSSDGVATTAPFKVTVTGSDGTTTTTGLATAAELTLTVQYDNYGETTKTKTILYYYNDRLIERTYTEKKLTGTKAATIDSCTITWLINDSADETGQTGEQTYTSPKEFSLTNATDKITGSDITNEYKYPKKGSTETATQSYADSTYNVKTLTSTYKSDFVSTAKGYYYCKNEITCEVNGESYTFEEGKIYLLEFSADGKLVTTEVGKNENGETVESKKTYKGETYSEDTAYATTVEVNGVSYNCFQVQNIWFSSYLTGAGSDSDLTVNTSATDSGYMCILTESEFTAIKENSGTNQTYGVASTANLGTIDITYKDSAYSYDFADATQYYLYFPYLGTVAVGGKEKTSDSGNEIKCISIASADTTKAAFYITYNVDNDSSYSKLNSGCYSFVYANNGTNNLSECLNETDFKGKITSTDGNVSFPAIDIDDGIIGFAVIFESEWNGGGSSYWTERGLTNQERRFEPRACWTFVGESVKTISDGAQFTSEFGLDYGEFISTYTASGIMTELTNEGWGASMTGKIFMMKPGDTNYQANAYVKNYAFYTIWYDSEQGTYSLKTIGDIDYSTTQNGDEYTKTKFINIRLLTVLVNSYSWKGPSYQDAHTGTGGEYEVVVTAFLHETATATDLGDETSKYTKSTTTDGKTVYLDTNNKQPVYSDTLRKYQVTVVG